LTRAKYLCAYYSFRSSQTEHLQRLGWYEHPSRFPRKTHISVTRCRRSPSESLGPNVYSNVPEPEALDILEEDSPVLKYVSIRSKIRAKAPRMPLEPSRINQHQGWSRVAARGRKWQKYIQEAPYFSFAILYSDPAFHSWAKFTLAVQHRDAVNTNLGLPRGRSYRRNSRGISDVWICIGFIFSNGTHKSLHLSTRIHILWTSRYLSLTYPFQALNLFETTAILPTIL
jgi:hypothetical protein